MVYLLLGLLVLQLLCEVLNDVFYEYHKNKNIDIYSDLSKTMFILEDFAIIAISYLCFKNGILTNNYWINNLVFIIFGYIFIRYAIYDIMRNITINILYKQKNSLNFIGSTKVFDKLHKKLMGRAPDDAFFTIKFVLLLIGICYIIQQIKT